MNFRLFLALATATTLSACGSANKLSVTNVDISTSIIGSDTYVTLSSSVKMGNLKFPGIEVPIINPTNLQQVLGQLSLFPNADGTNTVIVQVNYTEVSKMDPSLGKTLPNGRELPASLQIGNTAIIGIPVLKNSKIYVGGDLSENFYLGFALAIPYFDSVLTQVPVPLNIFFPFSISTSITGSAGVFTGPQNGQNGIALFAKRTDPSAPALASASKSSGVKLKIQTRGNEIERLDGDQLYQLDSLFLRRKTIRIH